MAEDALYKNNIQRLKKESEDAQKKFRENAEEERLEKEQIDAAAKKQQNFDRAKKIAVGTAAAAGAVGGAAVSGLKSIGRGISNAASSVGRSSGGSSEGASDSGLAFLFLIALFTHLIDAITKFQRPGFMIYVYIGIIVYTFFFLFKAQLGNSDETQLLAVIVLAYVLPYLPDLFPDSRWILVFSGLLFLFPLLPLYIGMKFPQQTFIGKASKWYMVFWVIVLAFYLITTFAPDMNTKSLVKNPMAGVSYVIDGVSKIFSKTFGSFNNALSRAIAQATGQPYEGQEESRVGIYVEDVKPIESKYNTNADVYVEARIKAVNVKEVIPKVNVICWIENVHQGDVYPAMLYDVIGDYDNIVSCNLGKLKEGNYEVKVKANFEFEGTSDIEYTFVNKEIKSDQYDKLGIDPNTIATYTGGPVEIGLPSLTQPLRVDVNTKGQLSSYPFGVSLKNKWPQGKVIRGIGYILNVPEEIRLSDCSRDPDPARKSEPDNELKRNIYVFEMNETNAGDTFDAVTCRMKFNDISALLGNDLKNVKTFAAKARYEYAVESSTMIIVEKN